MEKLKPVSCVYSTVKKQQSHIHKLTEETLPLGASLDVLERTADIVKQRMEVKQQQQVNNIKDKLRGDFSFKDFHNFHNFPQISLLLSTRCCFSTVRNPELANKFWDFFNF